MKSLSPAALAKIAETHGTEPIIEIGIEWVDGTILTYDDKNKILDLGELNEVLKIEGSPSSQISVVLDDTDGDLFELMKTNNLHKRPCYVYQKFEGLGDDDKFLLFKGEAVTPITWDEGKRQLSFDILSEVESEEVGFSPEEGQFPSVPASLTGRVWPLCFGSCIHVPATQSSEVVTGTTTSAVGIPDYTLPWKRDLLQFRLSRYEASYVYYLNKLIEAEDIAREPDVIKEEFIDLILEEDPLKQSVEDDKKTLKTLNEEIETLEESRRNLPPSDQADIDVVLIPKRTERDDLATTLKEDSDRLQEIKNSKDILEIELDNAEYEYKTIGKIREKVKDLYELYYNDVRSLLFVLLDIIEQSEIPMTEVHILDGENFPQGALTKIEIDGVILEGTFRGNTFSVRQFLPKYQYLSAAPRETPDIRSFWLNPIYNTVDLSGHYAILYTGDIVRITQQVGNRCTIELVERQSQDRKDPGDFEEDARSEILDTTLRDLEDGGAKEHTDAQIERIVEDAIEDTDNGTKIKNLKKNITDLLELLEDESSGVPLDDINVVRQALFDDINRYNELIAKLKLPVSVNDKINQLISQEEERFILKAENLSALELRRDQEGFDPEIPSDAELYSATGYDADFGIYAASPTLLPNWLPFFESSQLLGTINQVQALDPTQQIIVERLPPSTLWIAQPGSRVIAASDQREKHIANILPSTVHAVYAYKGVEGIRTLVPVPRRYYTINQAESLGGLTVTSITLNQPLSHYTREDWEDQLYVTLTSSVGPNSADIMKWVAENYTNLTVDSSSHSDLQTKLTNYPSNFALLNKEDAVKLIEEIAWQSRCVAYSKNGVLFFKYLSESPSPVATITESDIETETLVVDYTSTEDLATKFTAKWKATYAVTDPIETIVRHNINTYGSIEEERDFYIYNIESLVRKSATFWTIRKANTWKRVTFKTFLTNLNLEAWDTITLDLQDDLVASGPVTAIIEQSEYNSEDASVLLTCWVAVRAGELTEFDYAFPSSIDVSTIWPTLEDVTGGNVGNPRNVNVPLGSPPVGGNVLTVEDIEFRPKDFGTDYLSDDADVMPDDPIAGFAQIDYKEFVPTEHQVDLEGSLSDSEDELRYNSYSDVPQVTGQGSTFETFTGYVIEDTGHPTYSVLREDGQRVDVESTEYLYRGQKVEVTLQNSVRESSSIPRGYLYVDLVSVQDDHLVCIDENGNTINVAKPYTLRRSQFDGQTVNGVTYTYSSATQRSATDGSTTETQLITPDYTAGQPIQAEKVNGGSGVKVGDDGLIYVDANLDGRVWAVEE